jgi:hypothetical protein
LEINDFTSWFIRSYNDSCSRIVYGLNGLISFKFTDNQAKYVAMQMSDRGQNWTALLLTLMMVMVPALGVPYEELLQDTLKSILVAFFALASSFTFFWHQHKQSEPLNWHSVIFLPLTLTSLLVFLFNKRQVNFTAYTIKHEFISFPSSSIESRH